MKLCSRDTKEIHLEGQMWQRSWAPWHPCGGGRVETCCQHVDFMGRAEGTIIPDSYILALALEYHLKTIGHP